ncbi:MAG: pyruvoyl-dependent arginine decarboxylase [Bacteroidales bacterium]|nr:MAG: pyruvoyl-dependent arginine decarboxylase [Bacteroidales bacterium]
MRKLTLSGLVQRKPYAKEVQGILIGNRIPKDYFITKGTGESNITVHAGSYHLALQAAGIEMVNILTYSSILPGVATRINKPDHIEHGCVMETIMAVANGNKGERLSAGIIYGWLYDRESSNKYGGLVCEHSGNQSIKELKYKLESSINDIYYNGFEKRYSLNDIQIITESFVPEKEYGTALVALCFTSYIVPKLN